MTAAPAAPIPGFKALRSIRLGIDAHFAAGDLLPLPTTAAEVEVYLRLIEQGALAPLIDGKDHLTTIINHRRIRIPV